jgi:hypothetical protein
MKELFDKKNLKKSMISIFMVIFFLEPVLLRMKYFKEK